MSVGSSYTLLNGVFKSTVLCLLLSHSIIFAHYLFYVLCCYHFFHVTVGSRRPFFVTAAQGLWRGRAAVIPIPPLVGAGVVFGTHEYHAVNRPGSAFW